MLVVYDWLLDWCWLVCGCFRILVFVAAGSVCLCLLFSVLVCILVLALDWLIVLDT